MDFKTNLVLYLEGEVKSSGMFLSGLPKVVLLKSCSKFRHHLIKSLKFLIRIPTVTNRIGTAISTIESDGNNYIEYIYLVNSRADNQFQLPTFLSISCKCGENEIIGLHGRA